MPSTAVNAASGLFLLLLDRLFSWLPLGLSVCVWAVIAAFFFSIVVKIVSVILHFFFSFIDMIKP